MTSCHRCCAQRSGTVAGEVSGLGVNAAEGGSDDDDDDRGRWGVEQASEDSEEQTHGTSLGGGDRIVWQGGLFGVVCTRMATTTALRTLLLHLSMSARSRSNHGGQQQQPEEDNPMRLASDRPAAEQ